MTLFNRRQHNPDLFSQVEKLRGDRDGNLDRLKGRRWDAVIDTCGYLPRIVDLSATALQGSVDRYVFISTLSVYSDLTAERIDETAPVGILEDPTVEEDTEETYGPLKALCEQAVERRLPGRALVIRPGLIVGPHDPTDRFTYWPHRVAQGGKVLAPGDPQRTVQFIDVRDLADWTIRATEQGLTGIYNADQPPGTVTMVDLLDSCQRISDSDAEFVWFTDEALVEAGVGPWMELPLWVPRSSETRGFYGFDVSSAVRHGLTFRPIDDTVAATLEWNGTRPADHEWQAGMKPEREAELLH